MNKMSYENNSDKKETNETSSILLASTHVKAESTSEVGCVNV